MHSLNKYFLSTYCVPASVSAMGYSGEQADLAHALKGLVLWLGGRTGVR